MQQAPGKSHREGISLIDLFAMFPDDESATLWFESIVWEDGRYCGKCGSQRTSPVPNQKPMPYWCSDCRSYFSVKTGTAIAKSNVPLQKWCIAIYLCLTSLKSVSSMKLHRDIEVSQPTAWFMLHRIREAWMHESDDHFDGPVEVDEAYFGGLAKNKHKDKKLNAGRGAVGKTAVAGIKDRETNKVRAKTVKNTTAETLHGFIADYVDQDATVFTDDSAAYSKQANINGVESFWSMLKRGHKGTFHKISPKHLNRYVQEFAGKHNIRDLETLAQMRDTVARLVGRNLLHRRLTANNGLSS